MLILPTRKYSLGSAKYFLIFIIINWSSSAVALNLALIFFKDLDAKLSSILEESSKYDHLTSIVISPIFETLLLIYSLTIFGQILKSARLAIFASTIPVCLLHLPVFWQLPFIVFPQFYFQSLAYSALRCRFDRNYCIGFIVATHAVTNSITTALNGHL